MGMLRAQAPMYAFGMEGEAPFVLNFSLFFLSYLLPVKSAFGVLLGAWRLNNNKLMLSFQLGQCISLFSYLA